MKRPLTTAALLAEAAWVHRLALRLIGDPHAAADVAQATLVEGLVARTRLTSSPRAWLAGVLNNLARRAARSNTRRGEREARAAGSRSHGAQSHEERTPAELAARAEVHRQLVEAVTALPESYKLPLLLRYYDELTPAEIAAQLGLPLRTVHTRLARGLERVRQRLDAEHEDQRGRWMGALLAGVRGSRAVPLRAQLISFTGMALVLVTGSMALAWFVHGAGAPPRTAREGPRAEAAQAVLVPPVASPTASTIPERSSSAGRVVTADPGRPRLFEGRVTDARGRPLAGARIEVAHFIGMARHERGERTFTPLLDNRRTLESPTDDDGRFSLPLVDQALLIRASLPGFTPLADVYLPPDRIVAEAACVLAPARRTTGSVTDADGNGIAHARCELRLPEDALDRAPSAPESSQRCEWVCFSDEAGDYTFEEVPVLDGSRLVVTARNFEPLTVPLPHGAVSIDARLERGATLSRSTGWVFGNGGEPIPAAVVARGGRMVLTDASGGFSLSSPDDAQDSWVVVARGKRPLVVAAAAQHGVSPAGDDLYFGLHEAPLALTGVVTDARGKALEGQELWLADPTIVQDERVVLEAEAIAAGVDGYQHLATTDDEGRFRLDGLAARSYRLKLMDPETACLFVAGPFDPRDAGQIQIRRPADLLHARVVGVVREPAGQPLAGASVSVLGEGYSIRVDDQPLGVAFYANGSRTTTDDAGRFVLHNVPRRGVSLVISQRGVDFGLHELPDPLAGELDLVARRWCELRVDASTHATADAFELLDAAGRPVRMRLLQAFRHQVFKRRELVDGRSGRLSAPASVRTLVLLAGDKQILRVPLRLEPGTVQNVRL